jgi:hypothetical protein
LKHSFPCYTEKSKYTTIDGDDIGEALFCKVDIPPNTHFIAFDGIFRSLEDFQVRRSEGKGRYAVMAGAKKVFDCYEKSKQGKCQASKANNSLKLIHSISNTKAVKNSTMHHNFRSKLSTLKSGKFGIKANTEIMYSYGSLYRKTDYR